MHILSENAEIDHPHAISMLSLLLGWIPTPTRELRIRLRDCIVEILENKSRKDTHLLLKDSSEQKTTNACRILYVLIVRWAGPMSDELFSDGLISLLSVILDRSLNKILCQSALNLADAFCLTYTTRQKVGVSVSFMTFLEKTRKIPAAFGSDAFSDYVFHFNVDWIAEKRCKNKRIVFMESQQISSGARDYPMPCYMQ